ncbi:glycosyltransferase family 2 protein [Leuconostoc gelidum]|uniref:glycosyltransferase family 2 protein n=1 Tax=Leuconostoc gelidum TaxID=1244 RepID=UPI001CC7D44D|nr:glycosyltransferase family 2 protein [Leuconostoc gelidum]MBZ6001561.1 glycosyltransferase family 2 protein [Leuconostoc gelidum subsp. gelidum]
MNEVHLTVIVPVYNGENYIVNILHDLHDQTLDSVEFVIVNDGSVDNTANIINNFITNSADKRFKYIYQENRGVSAARNLGIHNSVGNYIIFIDGDDSVEKDLCASYYHKIFKNKTDIEFFPFQTVNRLPSLSEGPDSFVLTNRQLNYGKYSSSRILNNDDILKLIFNFRIQGYPFGYVSKRSLWQNVKFDTNVYLAEDLLALVQTLVNNKGLKIHINDSGKYKYVVREDSALQTSVDPFKSRQLTKLFKRIIKICESNGYSRKHVNNLLYGHYVSLLKQSVINGDVDYYREIRNHLWSDFLSTRMPLMSRMKRITILICCLSPNIYFYQFVLGINRKEN